MSLEDKAFDGGLDWMQSSFTAQSDGTYVRRNRTRQEPTEVTFALVSLFELGGLSVFLSLYMLLTRIPEARNISLLSLNLCSIFW